MKKIIFVFLFLIITGSVVSAICFRITCTIVDPGTTGYWYRQDQYSQYLTHIDCEFEKLHNGPDTLLTLKEVIDFAEAHKPKDDFIAFLETFDHWGTYFIFSLEAFDTTIYGIEYISTEPNAEYLRQKYNKQ